MTHNELGTDDMSFQLLIRQQPLQSRVCGVGEKVDRRPIDPPLIVELQITTSSTITATLKEECMTQLFLTAVLVPSSSTDHDETSSSRLDLSLHAQLTVGRTVSSLYHFKDLDGLTKCFFVFSDLSIRIEGSYRFRLCLFQITGSSVSFQQSILTDAFTVYSAKKFPGMFGSCPLARCFADQGLKIRIRNQSGPRQHRRRHYHQRYASSNRHNRLYSGSRSPMALEDPSDQARSPLDSTSPSSQQSQSNSSPRIHSLPSITTFLSSSSPQATETTTSTIPIHNNNTTSIIASHHTPALLASSPASSSLSPPSQPVPPPRLPPFSDFIQSMHPHPSSN
ncbi:unnamed protein product [Absidia cylindrospora]